MSTPAETIVEMFPREIRADIDDNRSRIEENRVRIDGLQDTVVELQRLAVSDEMLQSMGYIRDDQVRVLLNETVEEMDVRYVSRDDLGYMSQRIDILETREDRVLSDDDIAAMGYLKEDAIRRMGFASQEDISTLDARVTVNEGILYSPNTGLVDRVVALEEKPDVVLTDAQVEDAISRRATGAYGTFTLDDRYPSVSSFNALYDPASEYSINAVVNSVLPFERDTEGVLLYPTTLEGLDTWIDKRIVTVLPFERDAEGRLVYPTTLEALDSRYTPISRFDSFYAGYITFQKLLWGQILVDGRPHPQSIEGIANTRILTLLPFERDAEGRLVYPTTLEALDSRIYAIAAETEVTLTDAQVRDAAIREGFNTTATLDGRYPSVSSFNALNNFVVGEDGLSDRVGVLDSEVFTAETGILARLGAVEAREDRVLSDDDIAAMGYLKEDAIRRMGFASHEDISTLDARVVALEEKPDVVLTDAQVEDAISRRATGAYGTFTLDDRYPSVSSFNALYDPASEYSINAVVNSVLPFERDTEGRLVYPTTLAGLRGEIDAREITLSDSQVKAAAIREGFATLADTRSYIFSGYKFYRDYSGTRTLSGHLQSLFDRNMMVRSAGVFGHTKLGSPLGRIRDDYEFIIGCIEGTPESGFYARRHDNTTFYNSLSLIERLDSAIGIDSTAYLFGVAGLTIQGLKNTAALYDLLRVIIYTLHNLRLSVARSRDGIDFTRQSFDRFT